MISLMMCDDHIEVRDEVLKILEKDPNFNICARAATGEECIDIIESGTIPDLLILDISLPKMHGYDVARIIRPKFPQIKILVFSVIDNHEAVKAMIRFDVHGFAFKGISSIRIEDIIFKIIGGEIYYPPNFVFTAEQIQAIKDTPIPWAELITEKEMTVVKLAANNLPRKQIADKMGISVSVVNKKMENIFKKIGRNTTLAVVNFLKDLGLIYKNPNKD